MWSCGHVVMWSVMWSYGHVVIRSCGHTVMWLYGHVVIWKKVAYDIVKDELFKCYFPCNVVKLFHVPILEGVSRGLYKLRPTPTLETNIWVVPQGYVLEHHSDFINNLTDNLKFTPKLPSIGYL